MLVIAYKRFAKISNVNVTKAALLFFVGKCENLSFAMQKILTFYHKNELLVNVIIFYIALQ